MRSRSVAHVMEMTGRPEDGLGWMAAREALWSTAGHVNQVHIWWHKALFHLELGQYDAAFALYDGPMRATQRPPVAKQPRDGLGIRSDCGVANQQLEQRSIKSANWQAKGSARPKPPDG